MTHSGERATLLELHTTYVIPSDLARTLHRGVKNCCKACIGQQTLPKSDPSSYILSNHFGERILVDCKTLTLALGYLVVAVDHFTTHLWSTHVERKFAGPIAAFVASVFDEVDSIRKGKPELKNAEEMETREVWWADGFHEVRWCAYINHECGRLRFRSEIENTQLKNKTVYLQRFELFVSMAVLMCHYCCCCERLRKGFPCLILRVIHAFLGWISVTLQSLPDLG